jgi:hypothetical protein
LKPGQGPLEGRGGQVLALAAPPPAWGFDLVLSLSGQDAALLLDTREGSVLPLSLEGAVSAPRTFASASSLLFGLDREGSLLAWDREGRRLWALGTGIVDGTLRLADNRLVVVGKGRAQSVSYSGEVWREATITSAVSPGLLAPSGLLFSAGADWVLAAYRYEAALPEAGGRARPGLPPDDSPLSALLLFTPGLEDESAQRRLVDDIEKRLDSGTIGESEPGDRAVLEALVRGDFSAGLPATRQRFRLFALPRVEALVLLGEIGSPASLPLLAEMAEEGSDSSVKAAAIGALAAIGVDPEGIAAAAFARLASSKRLDDQVAWALVDAIEVLSLRSGSAPSLDMARALLSLTGPPFTGAVRERATTALARLARGE